MMVIASNEIITCPAVILIRTNSNLDYDATSVCFSVHCGISKTITGIKMFPILNDLILGNSFNYYLQHRSNYYHPNHNQ